MKISIFRQLHDSITYFSFGSASFKTGGIIRRRGQRYVAKRTRGASLITLCACLAWLGALCGFATPVYADEVTEQPVTETTYITAEELNASIENVNSAIASLSDTVNSQNEAIADLQANDKDINNALVSIDTRLDNYIKYVADRDKTTSQGQTDINKGYVSQLGELKDEINSISVLLTRNTEQIEVLNSGLTKSNSENTELIRKDLSDRWMAEDGYNKQSTEDSLNFSSVFVIGIGMVVGAVMGQIFTRWYQNVCS